MRNDPLDGIGCIMFFGFIGIGAVLVLAYVLFARNFTW